MPSPTELLGRRIEDAERFLALGREEVRDGKGDADAYRVRQGMEKIFHALSNAYVARLYAYRRYHEYPTTHEAVLEGLESIGLRREARFFEEIKEVLHGRIYYQGEAHLFDLAERYVDAIASEIEGSLDRIAEVR